MDLPETTIDLPPDVIARMIRGLRIRNARWRRKMTQEDLAKLVGVTRQTIVAAERKGTMSRHTRARLEIALGLDLDLRCGCKRFALTEEHIK